MWIQIVGDAKLLDSGEIRVPIRSVNPYNPKQVKFPVIAFPVKDIPPRGWDDIINSSEPHRFTTSSGKEFYVFRGKVVEVEARNLSEAEIKLEVANEVLKHETRYRQLQRQLEALNNVERAENERRVRIPDDVRLFVWQRDQGKCVKCGNNERLEFDHIIPVAKGGGNTERNVQLLCESCNRQKGVQL